MPDIRLPDGSVKAFPHPVSVAEVAASIGSGLARAALAGKVNGKLVDTSYCIDADADLAIVTDRDAEGLDVLRHSTAHLLAHAVKELFPDAQVTIGPVIEDGFYYDFSYKRPFTPEDLEAIEKRMAEIAKRDLKIERRVWDRSQAIQFFKDQGEHYKAQIIESIPGDEAISLYQQDNFTDLCRGPHVPSTAKLKVFKLMKVAGAYWRGDSHNEMLQRIYGTAWARKEDLDAYLHRLEEAEKRDHRKLGKQLDLFHLQDEAPGMVFWHPNGWVIWQQIEQYMRRMLDRSTATGRCARRRWWTVRCGSARDTGRTTATSCSLRESEKRDYAVKPMNCPGHVLIFNQGIKSYRDLPLRLAEFGSCHRNEPSGALHGIMRVRGFVQDDAHIFCTEDAGPGRGGGLHRPAAQDLPGLRLRGDPDQARHPSGQAHRRGRDLGPRRGCAAGSPRRQGSGVGAVPGRRRVLWPQDRVLAQGLASAGSGSAAPCSWISSCRSGWARST